jgi:NADH:ubiquinone oxidoreductase subunit H
MITMLRWEIGLFLGGLAAIIFYQMLTGRINTSGLLQEKTGKGELSWVRVQSLFFTFIFAVIYITQVVDHPTQLPKVPQEMVALLGGSNLAYLGGKAYNLLFRDLSRF